MDKLHAYEKISLGANQISFMANNLNLIKFILSQGDNSQSVQNIDDVLEETAKTLTDAMNNLVEFSNHTDATTILDNKLFNPIIEELNK